MFIAAEVPTEPLAPCREPILGQDVLAIADVGRDLFELHAEPQRVCGAMQDAIMPLGEDDHLVSALCQQLIAPPLPANGLPRMASRSPGSRYPVASAHMSRVHRIWARTARSVFRGGCPRAYCCLAALIQQFATTRRSSSSSKGRKGLSPELLVKKTVLPPGPCCTAKGQGIDALHPTQDLQPVEQDMLYKGDHLAVAGRAVDLRQQPHHPHPVQEVEAVIEHSPFVQPVHPIHELPAVQTSCHLGIVAAGDLSTPWLCQVLRSIVPYCFHGPPPSAACFTAR
jgi:hypothetical protein